MGKIRRNGIIVLLVLSILGITGCQAPLTDQMKIAVICTSALQSQSELILLNKDGKEIHSLPLKAQGIFTIEQPKTGQLVLPVMYSDEIIFIDLAKTQAQTRKTKQYPLFYKDLGDAEFIIYNSDTQGNIDYLTYDLSDNHGEQSLRLKGFPLAVTIVDRKVYMYLDKKGESDSILVLDLNPYHVENEFTLEHDLEGVSDLVFANDQLLIPHSSTNELVIIPLANAGAMSSIPLNYAAPHRIFAASDQFIVVHYTGGISLLDKETYQTDDSTQLPYNILHAQLLGDQLYLLVKDGQLQRKIILVDLKSWNIEKTIEVQCENSLLVQNFLVLE